MPVESIIWCTGADPDLRWLAAAGPEHSEGPPGVHFLGLPYQRTLASHLLGGVGLDARALVGRIQHHRTTSVQPP